jgi:hypothetical protein
MLRRSWLTTALVLGAVGCGPESGTPVEAPPAPPLAAPETAPEALLLERTARRLALAMGTPEFRQQVRHALERSPHWERKIELQRLLRENGRLLLGRVAEASGDTPALIEKELDAAGSLELYLPQPDHRSRWRGADDILVATAFKDGDTPIAFDVRGRRHTLDRKTPPPSPVLALLPSETDFTPAGLARATCTPETCPTEGGGGGGGGSVPQAPRGIYLTQTSIFDLKEDWLRGAPEIEAMFLGPLSDTSKMNLIACANESSLPPRYYDQDRNNWSGNVLIADTLQLERVRAAYPPGTPRGLVRFTIQFWEDDTGRCQIATNVNSWTNKLKALGLAVLGGLTVLGTDFTQPVDTEAWPFIIQLPLGLLGLIGTIGGNDDFIGQVVNRSVWNPLHPEDMVFTTQVILDGTVRNGTASLAWR